MVDGTLGWDIAYFSTLDAPTPIEHALINAIYAL